MEVCLINGAFGMHYSSDCYSLAMIVNIWRSMWPIYGGVSWDKPWVSPSSFLLPVMIRAWILLCRSNEHQLSGVLRTRYSSQWKSEEPLTSKQGEQTTRNYQRVFSRQIHVRVHVACILRRSQHTAMDYWVSSLLSLAHACSRNTARLGVSL